MKFLVLLCLLGVFTATFAKKHHHSKFHAAFKGLIDLAEGDDELNKVAVIIAAVQDELQTAYDELNNQWSIAESEHESNWKSYHEQRESGEADRESSQEQLDSINTVVAELNEAIRISLDSINNAESQIDALNAQRETDHAAFAERNAALDKAIEAAQEALQLVIEVAEKDLGTSFLEISNKKITKHFHAIAHKLDKKNTGYLSTSMAQLLAEATADGINSDVAGQLVDLIERLIETLSAEQDGAVKLENDQIEQTNSAIDGYNGVISTESASASANQEQVSANEFTAAGIQNHINDINYWLDYYADVWSGYQSEFEKAKKNYEEILRRLRGDMDALEVAKQILADNGATADE